jgi:hypothetical protein
MEEQHKMAVRIQLRRDTAANWVSANPTLRAGEIGIETDTLKFKVGNGTSTWTQITAYANVTPTSLTSSLGDYILAADQGTAGGPAELDSNGDLIVPENSVILWNDADYDYTTTLTATQPTADRTITFKNGTGTVAFTSDIPSNTDTLSEGTTNKYFTDERAQDAISTALAAGTHTNITVTYNDNANSISLAAAPGYVDEQAVDAVAAALAAGTHTNITVTYNDEGNSISLTGATTYSDENAQDAIGNAVGTGLSYNDSTGAISVDTSTIQARVADVSDTEIGYLNGVTSAIQTQLDNKLALSGGTLTGALTLSGSPSSPLHAATKAYVDNTTAGLNFHAPVHAATSTNITTDYSNGTDGVGATLTAMSNGAIGTIDGHQILINERVLVKAQTNAAQNGIYYVSDAGGSSSKWVLTRALDADNSPSGEIAYGDFCFVQNGTLSGGYGYIVNTTGTITIGTTNISYVQFNAGQTVAAGNGLTEPSVGVLAIDTTITADLSTAQTLTNKTINANANTITVTSANVSDFNEAAQDAIGNILGTGLSYNDAGPGIGINNAALSDYLLDGVSGSSYGLIGTSAYLDVKNTNGYNKEIELDIAAVKTQLNTDGYITTSSTSTLTNKTLTSPKINEDVAVTATATELNYVDGVTSSIQTQLDAKVDESLFDTKGDLLVASADNTPAKLAVGTNGYLLTANSSATNGVEWAAAPVSLPTQTDNGGKYLTTDGTTASWATLVVPIETGTATVSANTATTIDTTALSAFTSIEYMVSLKQGSKIRTSKVLVQTDGTSVDMTEFGITETGGTIAGVVVSAAVSSTNAVLQLTATDATSTNVTVKFSKVKL